MPVTLEVEGTASLDGDQVTGVRVVGLSLAPVSEPRAQTDPM
jgi:hypothetical protein